MRASWLKYLISCFCCLSLRRINRWNHNISARCTKVYLCTKVFGALGAWSYKLVQFSMIVEVIFLVILLSIVPILFSLRLVNLIEDVYDWDKSSPYECGFMGAEAPGDFSSRFFHLVILFLVWDVEIVLLIPCFQDLSTWSVGRGALAIFLLVLALGLYYEIIEGTIKWSLQSD